MDEGTPLMPETKPYTAYTRFWNDICYLMQRGLAGYEIGQDTHSRDYEWASTLYDGVCRGYEEHLVCQDCYAHDPTVRGKYCAGCWHKRMREHL